MKVLNAMDKFLWSRQGLEARIHESDILSQDRMFVLHIVGLAVTLQMTVLMLMSYIERFVLFLTQWSAAITCLYFCSVVIYCLLHKHNCRPSWLWKLTHVLFEFAFTLGVVVTVVFWAVIIPVLASMSNIEDFIRRKLTWFDYMLNIEIHGVNYLFVFTEFCFNRIEFVWTHYILVLLFGLAYMMLLVTHTLYTHTPVYPLITFDNWISLVFVLLALLSATLSFALGVCLSQRKKKRYVPACFSSASLLTSSPPPVSYS